MRIAALIVLALFLFAIVIVAACSWCFRQNVAADVHSLLESRNAVGAEQLHQRWNRLPDPVQRYLRFAIPEDAPAIATARLEHNGYFRTSPGQSWMKIEGRQYFTAGRPGFVWNATVHPLPLIGISARDRLITGHGNMLVKFLSTFTIADASGPEIDQGSRLRWLAEAAWFPYAFVSDEIAWEPIDAHSARATLRCDGLPVSAVFEFGEDGRLSRLSAERYRDTGDGKAVLNAWTGHYLEYREFNGFQVPASVQVSWELENGLFTYARFHITSLDYNVNHKEKDNAGS
jgi:hypothetical protein